LDLELSDSWSAKIIIGIRSGSIVAPFA
jgi:hypothetical protein